MSPPRPVVSGNQVTLSYRGAEGFTLRMEYTIHPIGGTARVTGTKIITSESNAVLDLDFLNDIDRSPSQPLWSLSALAPPRSYEPPQVGAQEPAQTARSLRLGTAHPP